MRYVMENITIKISKKELSSVLDAYNTLQSFLSKILPPNELYHQKFLTGLREAKSDVNTGQYVEVNSFEEFIS